MSNENKTSLVIPKEKIEEIATAIRNKAEKNDKMTISEMISTINNLMSDINDFNLAVEFPIDSIVTTDAKAAEGHIIWPGDIEGFENCEAIKNIKWTPAYDKNLVSGNILQGIEIFNVKGNFSPVTQILEDKDMSKTPFTSNGPYLITPNAGANGMASVAIKIDVDQYPNITESSIKLITGTIDPGKNEWSIQSKEGEAYSKVTVKKDNNLKAENIAEGITIYGIQGSHSQTVTEEIINLPATLDTETKNAFPGKTGYYITPKGKNPEGVEYNGLTSIYVPGDVNLDPKNIANGVSIFNVQGTFKATQEIQDKEITLTADMVKNGCIIEPDEGKLFSKVILKGDYNFSDQIIGEGETVFGITGKYVSPMTTTTVYAYPSPRTATPVTPYKGFSSVVYQVADVGDLSEDKQAWINEGYNAAEAYYSEQITSLNEMINKLTSEKQTAYNDGYNQGKADGYQAGSSAYKNLDGEAF